VLCCPVATLRTEGKHESGIHHQANQARDFKIESGITSARRPSKAEGDEADKNTTPENISGWQKKNRCRSAGKVEESQGSKEVTPSLFPDRSFSGSIRGFL
jgi:hypothetical protein